MTDKQPALFDWATELSDAQGRVTLSEQEAHEIGARLRSMGEKLKTYEDLGDAGSDVQLLRMGYDAARLEIESLQARSVAPDPRPVVEMCAKALAEELAAWDIDPPLHHVKEAHDACELWLAAIDADRAMRAAQSENLHCKSTQKRLATQWGFVPAGAQQPSTTAQPVAQQEAQEPVAWYVTGCCRLLDEYEAKAEARHIGGTARAIPLYTAPQPSPAAPSDAELRKLADECGIGWAAGLGGMDDFLSAFARAVLAKWGTPTTQPSPAAQGDALDTALLDWLNENIFWREMGEWDAKYGHGDGYNTWVLFAPKGVQGSARTIISAARAAQEGKSHG